MPTAQVVVQRCCDRFFFAETAALSARSHSSNSNANCASERSYSSFTTTSLVMSEAISGLVMSFESSAMRFSSSVTSASMISGPRGFLMILTRLDSRDLAWPDFDPAATAGGTDFILALDRRNAPCSVSIDEPSATAGGSDLPAFQSWYSV